MPPLNDKAEYYRILLQQSNDAEERRRLRREQDKYIDSRREIRRSLSEQRTKEIQEARRITGDDSDREEIINEYAGICPYCNQPIEVGEIDHIIPVSGVGTNARGNRVYICAECNRRKGQKTLLRFLLDRRI